MNKKQKVYLPFKRLIDIIVSIICIPICLVFFWWWIFIINLVVSKGHPFFAQRRYGRNNKVFRILKFRTMKCDADSYLPPSDMDGLTQYNMETGFGHFLRKTQLDETLQLFNILVGQMSFVGPRPGAAKNEDNLVIKREKLSKDIYSLRPGLTGLAQIELNENKHDPKLKAEKDYEYLKNVSFTLDIKIFLKTLFKFFIRY